MAMMPTVLPLNVDFSAYQVLLPVKGKEFVVGVHNVEPGKPLRVAKLDCCNDLRKLLSGFEHIIQERLNQSMDVSTFVEELKDVVEHILLAEPQVKLAPAAYFGRIYSEIEEMGWEHIAWVAPTFMSIHLRFFDEAIREHLVQIQLSPDYPEREPTCNADLPVALELQWRGGGRLKDILSQFQQAAEKYQEFWTVMEDIDKHVWVMEPEHPSRSNCFRRIALGGHCSLCITVEPFSPRLLPEYRFFGSDTAVDPLRQRMSSNMGAWKMERLVRENLEDVLGITFPSPQDADRDDVSSECIICYSYRLLDGKEGASEKGSVPDRVCDNGSCGRPFHTSCLAEWLRSLPTTRQSFDVLFGACPHCSHPIIVKCSFS